MKITDYKQYIIVRIANHHYNYKFPEEFAAFYKRAETAFGGIQLLNYGRIIASNALDHINWDRPPAMKERIANIFSGKEDPYRL